MLKHFSAFLLLSSGLAFALPSKAAVIIYSDNFDANTSAFGATPINWTITNGGTVDIGINGSWGQYIELGGNTNKPGQLTRTSSLTGGKTYTLTYQLEGSDINTSDALSVIFGTSTRNQIVLKSAAITTFSMDFTAPSTGNYDVSFLNGGTNNEGAKLITASLSEAPAPLPILGIAAVFGFSRKLRNRIKKAKPEVISTVAR